MIELDLRAGRHVVDLGAGTGIFSRQLAEFGLCVTAIEPVSEMRANFAKSVSVTLRAGAAEATGLAGSCADAVVAATAWHWFDAGRAIKEVR